MADSDITFQGIYYAVGYQVSVSVCGLDCGDYTVAANGSVTVPINSDPDENFNGAYLAQFDVGPFDKTTYGDATTRIDLASGNGSVQTIYVPVVIGFNFPAIGLPLRPLGEDQTKTPQGPALGKTRRTHFVAALLRNTQGITFFSPNSNQDQSKLTDNAGNPLPMNMLFSGVWVQPFQDNDSYDSFLGWAIMRPYACSIVSIEGFVETSER